ncbi:PAS domain-containing protein [Candidatus Electrothrix laxa]
MVTEEKGILREVLDALPSVVFVVDRDVRIQEYNTAAAEFIKAARGGVLQHRAGDILHCIHASAILGGCSRSSVCRSCTIRNSVIDALDENCVIRRRAQVQLISPKKIIEMQALITVSPFSLQGSLYALLMIEDIKKLAELYRMLLVCHACGKMLDGESSCDWPNSSLKNNWNIDCSYSYCPDCFSKEIEKFDGPTY